MKKVITWFACCVMAFGFLVTVNVTPSNAEAKYKISLAHVEKIDSRIQVGAVQFKELVEQRTKGEVEVNIFPASQLGSGTDLGQMTQTGAIQISILPTGHIGGIFPEVQVFDIPFLLPQDMELEEKVLNGRAGKVLAANVEKLDMKVLGYYPSTFKQFTSNKPIYTPNDFKGLKWRTMASPLIVESYKILGASPVAIDYQELYTALQLGTVDGQENSIWTIGAMKYYEVQKYVIISNHGAFIQIMLCNKQWFEKLPGNIQKIISEASIEILPNMRQWLLNSEKEYYDTIAKYPRTKIIKLTPENSEAFRKVLTPVKNKYIEIMKKDNRGMEIIKAFDEELARLKK